MNIEGFKSGLKFNFGRRAPIGFLLFPAAYEF